MEWISVKDKLPDNDDFYLIVYTWKNKKGCFVKEAFCIVDLIDGMDIRWCIAHPSGEVDWSDDDDDLIVTHWMPLPELPKEEKDV